MDTEVTTQTIPNDTDATATSKPKASWILKACAIALPFMSMAIRHGMTIFMVVMGAELLGGQVAEMVGSAIGLFLAPTVVVGLFQINRRFRNSRSRWKIYLVTSLVLLLGSCAAMLNTA